MMRLLPLMMLAGAGTAANARPAAVPAAISTQVNCDALSTDQRLDAATLRDLGPAHSLDAAAAVLNKHHVKFERSKGVMTLSSIPASVIRDINALPQGEPMILPSREGSTICVLLPSADSI